MSKKMPFRFRKSFPLLGRFLQGTVTKKGLSLNMRLGPLAKSWGTGRRRSTTVDMPGMSGIFWRSQTKASKDEAIRDRELFWAWTGTALWLVFTAVLAVRMLIEGCSGWIGLGIVVGVGLIIFFASRGIIGIRRIGSLLVMVLLMAGAWLALPLLAC